MTIAQARNNHCTNCADGDPWAAYTHAHTHTHTDHVVAQEEAIGAVAQEGGSEAGCVVMCR